MRKGADGEGKSKGRAGGAGFRKSVRHAGGKASRKGRAGGPDVPPAGTSLASMLETLGAHDHLCLIHETKEEWRGAVIPFISIGLLRGEKCLYIVDTSTAEEIRQDLLGQGFDVRAAEESGRLCILHESEAYTRDGAFDPGRMIGLLAAETERAIKEGYPALRVTGEMTWVLRGIPGSDRLLEYEARLNSEFFPFHACLALCQYDRWKFDPEIIKGVVMTHPHLVRGGRVHRNFYYIPPEEFLNSKRAELEVQHWLNNLTREDEMRRDLGASEERWRITLLSVGDGVIVTDSRGAVELLNPAAEALTGWKEADARGKPLEEVFRIVNEGTLEKVEDPVRRVLREGRVVGLANHTVLITRDGSRRFIADSGAPVRGAGGVVTGVVLVFRDQTAERAAEAALEESEERFRNFFDNAPIGKSMTAPDGRLLRVNPAICGMLGYSSEEMQSMSFASITHPDDLAESVECVRSLLAGERDTWSMDKRYVAKDGRHVWTRVTTRLQRDASGKPLHFLTHVEDVTARRQAGEALKESEERFRIAARCATDLIWEWDIPSGSLQWFGAVDEILGHEPGGFQRTIEAWEGIIHTDDRDRVMRNLRLHLETGAPYSEEYRVQRKDGTWTDWTDKGVVRKDGKGRPFRMIGVCTDITRRKQAEEEKRRLEEQFAQAQKMESVGRLAGGVAHDFNNMLGVIIGHAELALAQAGPDHAMRVNLEEIHKAAMHSADLTRQLLAFARKQTVSLKVVDLNETVSGMLKMLQRLIGEDIVLAWTPGAGLWQLKIDPAQIDQILANVCVNARDAISGAGRVTIETRNVILDEVYRASHPGFFPGSYVMLAVSDNGCGMNREVLDHLFEPFFTTKEIGKGTGLGLATVYGIVRQNNGFINVYSEPGKGTTFKIYLPRFEGKETDVRKAGCPAEIPTGRGETVLLVEDEGAILRLGEAMLQKLGYAVLTAGVPGAALKIARDRQGRIDLLITDVVMPEMTGRELARELSSILPGLKSLFMSGYTANVIAHRGILDEGVHFIQKPFSLWDLGAKVREALEGGTETPEMH